VLLLAAVGQGRRWMAIIDNRYPSSAVWSRQSAVMLAARTVGTVWQLRTWRS
jgi:hypothetical protein